eukprot:scaffold1850_cov194-Pinguiococcus_pyrenoidosus.AAC.43
MRRVYNACSGLSSVLPALQPAFWVQPARLPLKAQVPSFHPRGMRCLVRGRSSSGRGGKFEQGGEGLTRSSYELDRPSTFLYRCAHGKRCIAGLPKGMVNVLLNC